MNALAWRVFASLFLAISCAAHAQTYEGKQLTAAGLVADTTAIVPGRTFTVALDLKMIPHWHSYWRYPGDAGTPTGMDWNLPEGFKAGAIQWPLPVKEDDEGDLESYVYGDEVLLLTDITPPAQIREKEITLRAVAKWLVCDKTCVPGGAELTLTLPVAANAAPANEKLFAKYRALLPKTDAPPFRLTWSRNAGNIVLDVRGAGESLDFFPLPGKDTTSGHPKSAKEGDATRFTIPVQSDKPPAVLDGLLVSASASWLVSAGAPAAASSGGLLKFLAFGFIGGFILNLMPCVLPVIALKIFGFINQAGESPGKVFRLGLAFVAGIFVWFLALAALVSGFKAAGRDINWSFQFQNPYCLIGMSAILFVFALNLFGVFEVALPQRAGGAALNLAGREGYGGAFFHGMFATLLATPCTAPFLGPALGFAFVQRAPVLFAVFTAIAAGMSFPYLLLTAQPAWMRFLPKPGMWMVRFKQFTGFLLLATLLWLLKVLGDERGADAIIRAASFLLCLGVACWMIGSLASGKAFALLIAASGFALFVPGQGAAPAAQPDTGWQAFSPDVLKKSLATGKPVFVDFTANWCLNCKYNERFVLDTGPVKDAFKKYGVIPLKADWTNGDPEITALLKKFGRAGVPVYAVYPAGGGDPVVLPEILTQQTVLDALARF